MALKVFLCHSSKDKEIAEEVWRRLGEHAAWLDKAEVELGDILLEKIAAGVEEASDFVLFWSKNASESAWVRFEVHMGFIRFLHQKGCRPRVVTLDDTPLPLYLQPFLFLDGQKSRSNIADLVCETLLQEAEKPSLAVRRLILNRHDELRRLELAVDSRESPAILIRGLPGIGKRTLLQMAVERFFSPPDIEGLTVRPGTAWVELALQLAAMAGLAPPEEGAGEEVVRSTARTAIEAIHSAGSVMAFYEVQHWVEEDGEPSEILATLLRWLGDIPECARRPVFLTSTRLPRLSPQEQATCQLVRIEGLAAEHLSALIRHWVDIEKGETIPDDASLKSLCSELCGYPLAARIAASLVAHYGIGYLLEHPRDIVELRVDIARDVVATAKVPEPADRILQALAVLDVPMPGNYIARALEMDSETFREGVDAALSFGLVALEGLALMLHPLVRDFYWRAFSQSDSYEDTLGKLAAESTNYLDTLTAGSEEYAVMLPAAFRLIALTGDLDGARALRRDLLGTLMESAIRLYNRREYPLALKYVDLILDGRPDHWQARLYRARCLIRTGNTGDARGILREMIQERPRTVSVLHALGRTFMGEQEWQAALAYFREALAGRGDHLPSLRESAMCYLRLRDLKNAQGFVTRAKEINPTNPFILQIESMILEERGQFDEAYEVMSRASSQDPENAMFEHRLGRIADRRRDLQAALKHYDRAASLDPGLVEARLSKISAMIDLGYLDDAQKLIKEDRGKFQGKARRVLQGIEAKLAFGRHDLERAKTLVKGDRAASSYALRAKIETMQASQHRAKGYAELASQALRAAESEVAQGLEKYPGNEGLLELAAELEGITEGHE